MAKATSRLKDDKSELVEETNPAIPVEETEHERQSIEEDELSLHRTPKVETLHQRSRKRKRKDVDDDLEGTYMQNLAREETREDQKRRRQDRSLALNLTSSKEEKAITEELAESDDESSDMGDGENFPTDAPQHESLSASKADSEVEKASRTVFLANVSTAAIKLKSGKKALIEHLASFLPSLPTQQTAHKVESLRFRSTAFNSNAVPKKAAFARKELMDSTTKSTNAYAVYTTQLAAKEATKRLNGSIILDRHLRVDSVAHPAKQDHRRCVFVGNLGFVDDESSSSLVETDVDKRPRKPKAAADVEEGLWRQFSKAGIVESVRVVRDKTTRVGKGFAYVQFEVRHLLKTSLLVTESSP